MVDLGDLEERHLDALCEVANIGSGHAATALSQMLRDRRVMINVPSVTAAGPAEVPTILGGTRPEEIVVGVLMRTLGDLTGLTALALPLENARLLCDFLLSKPPGTTTAFDELEASSVKEAGNIVVSAYLNALSAFMDMMILPSVPTFVKGTCADISDKLTVEPGHEIILCAATEFKFEDEGDGRLLNGQLLHLPDVPSLKAIFEATRVT